MAAIALTLQAAATVGWQRDAHSDGWGADPRATTSLGEVIGNRLRDADEFLGIPYGDAARFSAAVTASEPFKTQPLKATAFGPACIQTLTATTTYGVEHGCHVINIWRPAGTAAGSGLPLLMFVPGGANDYGEAEPYNASQMAADQRAVIASINYRVGPFGFLYFDEEVAAGRGSGNYAQTDVQAALRWLRREASAFGADGSRLSIFGQSSAAGLVLLHALMPSSAGLVDGVLSQSGGLGAASVASAASNRKTLTDFLNCTRRGFESDLHCLKTASADLLVFAQEVVCVTPNVCNAKTSWAPVVDGIMLPDAPDKLVAAGKVNRLAVALGANTNDSNLFVQQTPRPLRRAQYLSRLLSQVPPGPEGSILSAKLRQLYPPLANASADHTDLVGWFESDATLCTNRRLALGLSKAKVPVYLYRYNWWFQSNTVCTAASNWHEPSLGSMHQDEVTFVFGQPIFINLGYTNCSQPGWPGYDPSCLQCHFDPRDAGFSLALGRLWTNFAATGDPNQRIRVSEPPLASASASSSASLVQEWPEFGATGRNVYLHPKMEPSFDSQRMGSEPAMGRLPACEVWDEVARLKPHVMV